MYPRRSSPRLKEELAFVATSESLLSGPRISEIFCWEDIDVDGVFSVDKMEDKTGSDRHLSFDHLIMGTSA